MVLLTLDCGLLRGRRKHHVEEKFPRRHRIKVLEAHLVHSTVPLDGRIGHHKWRRSGRIPAACQHKT